MLTPSALLEEYPCGHEGRIFIEKSRRTIDAILKGKDERFLLIVGPCSIHHCESAKEYARRMKELSKKVSRSIFLVMRTYMEKPRTLLGWKGLVHDPLLDGSCLVDEGLRMARSLLLYLAKEEVPCALEFLEPLIAPYLMDLVSWGCIGARTVASQTHRQLASFLPMPVGFKNSVDGNVSLAVQGALVAKHPHTYLTINSFGQITQERSQGNSCTHIVLRGSDKGPNFDSASIEKTTSLLKKAHMPARFLIDCSHGNSAKNYHLQSTILQAILQQLPSQSIAGAMIESHLEEGSQPHLPHTPLSSHISLTDPCINWQTTEEIIMEAMGLIQAQA